jgi:hypothetical protein
MCVWALATSLVNAYNCTGALWRWAASVRIATKPQAVRDANVSWVEGDRDYLGAVVSVLTYIPPWHVVRASQHSARGHHRRSNETGNTGMEANAAGTPRGTHRRHGPCDTFNRTGMQRPVRGVRRPWAPAHLSGSVPRRGALSTWTLPSTGPAAGCGLRAHVPLSPSLNAPVQHAGFVCHFVLERCEKARNFAGKKYKEKKKRKKWGACC